MNRRFPVTASLTPIQAHIALHTTNAPSLAVSSARAGFLCLAAIFVRLQAACHTAARGATAALGGWRARPPPVAKFFAVLSRYAYAPATDAGGIASRLIRSRIAANNCRGTCLAIIRPTNITTNVQKAYCPPQKAWKSATSLEECQSPLPKAGWHSSRSGQNHDECQDPSQVISWERVPAVETWGQPRWPITARRVLRASTWLQAER